MNAFFGFCPKKLSIDLNLKPSEVSKKKKPAEFPFGAPSGTDFCANLLRVKKTYLLIAIGLFSIDYKKLTVNEATVISNVLKLGKTRNSKIDVAKISKPQKINNTVVASLSNATFKNNNIKIKPIQP